MSITTIHANSRPKLVAKARLRFDHRGNRFLLLYPERGLILNGPAGDILQLCTGECTLATIVDVLSMQHRDGPRELIAQHVLGFVSDLHSRGLIEE